MRDEIFDLCRRAHLSVRLEKGNGLTRDLDHTRPADILIAGWDRGKPVSHVTKLVQQSLQQRPVSGSYTPMDLNARSYTLVLHSIGSRDVWKLGQRVPGYHLQAGISPGHLPAIPQVISIVAEIYGRLNMTLIRSIARAILARKIPTLLTAYECSTSMEQLQEGLGLHLDPSQFQVAIISGGLAWTFPMVLAAHCALRLPWTHLAIMLLPAKRVLSVSHLGVQVEIGSCNVTPNHSHTCPADLLAPIT
ncbi:hypothetical protein EMCRGX_G001518 [Ephydatia muelleri]